MPIIMKSDENIRLQVIDYLQKKKASDPSYRVIDVGGAKNPWCDRYVDAYLDIQSLSTTKTVFKGDINDDRVWEEVQERPYDFSICTHTLEDIRRPEYVIHKLLTVSKAGFIAVPNKHTELSCMESVYWVGYGHHRWIFTLLPDDVLCIVAKLPITNYFIEPNRWVHLLGKIKGVDEIQYRLNRKPGGPGIECINRRKVSANFELGFLWEDCFHYTFLSADFPGNNIYEAAQLYREKMRNGL